MVKLLNWASRSSWKSGDRVVVAVGEHQGKHGTVYLHAGQGKYLVILDKESRARKFLKGALDPE